MSYRVGTRTLAIRALATLAGALAAGIALGCPGVAAAKAPHPVKVVDSGFRPPHNGYRFPNYTNSSSLPNLGPEEMQALFGAAVCASGTGASCVLSPPALAWMQEQNAAMDDGHCVGFSITALLFRAHLIAPSMFGGRSVPALTITGNDLLAREIAYGWTFQVLPAVRSAEVNGSPRVVLSKLESALRTQHELYTLAITQPDGSGGHAVTPYEVQRTSPGHYSILVYDNNYPKLTRTVLVNTRTNTWSYRAASTPGQAGSLYTGNASTRSLFLLPTRPGLGVQPCPFCASPNANTLVSGAARDRLAADDPAGGPYETIGLQTSGGGRVQLLITDPSGHRLGFVHGRFVNQIPGARVVSLLSGGPQTWLDGPALEEQVPYGQAYQISLSGAGGSSPDGHAASASSASVSVLGPGFLAAVRSISASAGSQINVPATGDAVTFTPHGGGTQTPELVLGNGQPGTTDHEWNVLDHGTPSNEPVSASLNTAGQTVSVTGGGNYDVSLDTVRSSVDVFGHNDLTVGSQTTATVSYAGTGPGVGLPVTDTANGRVTGHGVLSDEPSSFDSGTEFTPSDPGGTFTAPAGSTADASSTSVDCSPDPVAVDAPSTCDAEIDTADGSIATGVVSFQATGGTFSPSSCTLSAGSCSVNFTPTTIGSGSVVIDAFYGGDDSHVASEGSTSLDVDKRLTDTDPECPSSGSVGSTITCSATVTDDDAGTPSTPTGTVTFSTDDPSGSFPNGPTCQLSGSGASSSCSVQYTIGSDDLPADTISASYSGDAIHQSS